MNECLILAAGRGARLDRPNTPKPIVQLGGHPILLRTLDELHRVGITKAHVVVGYEQQHIRKVLQTRAWDNMEVVLHQNDDWETSMASSVLVAKFAMPQTFLLLMGDHLFAPTLFDQMVAVDAADNMVALVDENVSEIPEFEDALKVIHHGNTISKVGWNLTEPTAVEAGFIAANHRLFSALEAALAENPGAALSDGLARLAIAGQLRCVPTNGQNWDDIDTPAALVRAEGRWRAGRRSAQIKHVAPEIRERTVFDYVVGKPVHTDVVIERGAIQRPNPETLIPASAASSPVFVFTDETVGDLYGRKFAETLTERGYDVHLLVLPDGEESKTVSNYTYLVERVLSRGVDERSVFISIGGGVVCNVCGFVASTIYRGLDLIHLPTTLMAQSDAAISHKQAINGTRGKNMVGSYYSPRMVVVDVEVLDTLSERQFQDGLAEVLKHGLAQDVQMSEKLVNYDGNIRDRDFVESLVRRNVELKCEIVRNDPKELQEGMVLQYGHTVGHPIEHLSGYSLYHGEAVAIGMVVAARVARLLGACGDDVVDFHIELIRKFGLPYEVPAYIDATDMLAALKFNKRYLREGTRMALVDRIGHLWSVDDDNAIPVPEEVLIEAFELTRAKR